MPRKARPFIDKKEDGTETFVVVHRSQLDPKFYDDTASKFVLMSTKARGVSFATEGGGSSMGQRSVAGDGGGLGDGNSRVSGSSRRSNLRGLSGGFADRGYGAASIASARSRATARVKTLSVAGGSRGIRELSEVDEEGFPIDGYDYGRHMAAMGGGTYISSSGSVLAAGVALTHGLATRLDIPDDVLPSHPDDDLDRMLEAINLNATSLPADLREVMAAVEEADEEDEQDFVFADDDGEGSDEGGDEAEEEGEGGADVAAADDVDNEHCGNSSGSAPRNTTAHIRGDNEPDNSTAAAESTPVEAGASSSSVPSVSTKGGPRVAHVVSAGGDIDDDFILRASGEVAYEPTEGATDDADDDEDASAPAAATRSLPADFDFDAHVARLMARAEGKWVDSDDYEEGQDDEEGGDDDEDDDGDDDEGDEAASSAAAPASAASSTLNAQLLHAMLAQYDDDEIGELDDEDPRLRASGFRTAAPMRPDDEESEGEEGSGDDDEEEGGDAAAAASDADADDEEDDVAADEEAEDGIAPLQQQQKRDGQSDAPPVATRVGAGSTSSSVYSGDTFTSSASRRRAAEAIAANEHYTKKVLVGVMDEYLRDRDDQRKEYEMRNNAWEKSREKQRNRRVAAAAAAAAAATTAVSSSATAHISAPAALAGATPAMSIVPAVSESSAVSRVPDVTTSAAQVERGTAAAPTASSAADVGAPAPAPVPAAPAAPTAAFKVKIGLLPKRKVAAPASSPDESVSSSASGSLNAAATSTVPPPFSASCDPVVAAAATSSSGPGGIVISASLPAAVATPTAPNTELTAPASGAMVPLGAPEAATSASASVAADAADDAAPPVDVPFGFAEDDFPVPAPESEPADVPFRPLESVPRAPRWDAETVISTYTNTENHPRTLADGVSITSSRTGHFARKLADVATAGDAAEAAAPGTFTGYGPVAIRLSKKTGLPMLMRTQQQQQQQQLAGGVQPFPVIAEEHARSEEEEDADDSEDDESASDDDDGEEGGAQETAAAAAASAAARQAGGDTGAGGGTTITRRRPDETAAEKHERKAAVKAERRMKRSSKKQLKTAYKQEQLRQEDAALARQGAAQRGVVILA